MLNTKLFLIFYQWVLKISLRSSKYGLSYSLKDTWRSSSKFTQYHWFGLMRDKIEKRHCFSLRNYSKNLMDFLKMQISNWKMSWDKNNFSKASNFDTKIQKHWNQIRRIHNDFVCKFLIWPPIVLEAIAEAILAWPQWNFQILWVKYQS